MNATNAAPQVIVVAAGAEEAEQLSPAMEALEAFGITAAAKIASSLAAPAAVLEFARQVERAGARVLLAAAGREPALPGLLAAACRLPVIAVPTATNRADADPLVALDCLGDPDAPVGLVAAVSARQAAMFAARVVALSDPGVRDALDASAQMAKEDVEEQDARLAKRPPASESQASNAVFLPQQASQQASPRASAPGSPRYSEDAREMARVRRADELNRPLVSAGNVVRGQETPGDAGGADQAEPPSPPRPARPARSLGRLTIDMDSPDVAIIEDVVDCLLEGGVIAFPTETVYGLAADATNLAAVERLFALKGRDRDKAVSLMVDSSKLLASIAQNVTVEVRRLMEAFWPGAMTLIFQKRPGNFRHVSPGETIGVRLPDHSVPLAIMQALARPLACTSANLAGQPEARTGKEIEALFRGRVNVILDGGPLPQRPPSTVVDVSREPFRILRQGSITREQISAVVGEMLEIEG